MMAFIKIVTGFLLLRNFVFAADNAHNYSHSNADFSSDFFGHIVDGNQDKNIIVSPSSVHSCLAMTFLGADGTTATEMVQGLHFGTNDKHDISERAEQVFETLSKQIKFANRIYLKEGKTIKPDFNDIVKKSFKAEAETLDFEKTEESAHTINKWVEDNTNNKIKNLVKPSTIDGAIMILVNAVHFKAQWLSIFDFTTKKEFWVTKDKSIQAELMQQLSSFKYGKLDNLDAIALEMPYEDSDLSMLIILPNQRDGLENLENKLKTTDLMQESSVLKTTQVSVTIPKFEFEYEIRLNDILKDMGMKTMFEDNADFSAMISGAQVKISEVVHKAYIKLDENGTEAAAAAYAKATDKVGILFKPETFTADHPFVFAIKDRNAIHFLGHVVHP